MKYILIIAIILFSFPGGFSGAANRVNGGPAQLPQQNILQPKPVNTAPNLNSNVDSQTNQAQNETQGTQQVPSPVLSGQEKASNSQNSQNSQNSPGAATDLPGGRFSWLGWLIFACLIVAAVWWGLGLVKK